MMKVTPLFFQTQSSDSEESQALSLLACAGGHIVAKILEGKFHIFLPLS